MRLICLFGFLLCIHSAVYAQDSLLYGSLPDSIVITATRYQESQAVVGQRISVLDAEDIASMPVSSFDELLRSVAGVEVFSRFGFGVQSDITIRGGTFNGVLLLVDGIRFNDAQTGHFLTDFPIPLSQIARIEVLRGPATVVHGPDALSGVIHVITKGGSSYVGQKEVAFSAGSKLGSHNLRTIDSDIQYSTRKWSIGGAISYQATDGEVVQDELGPIEGPNGIVQTDFNRFANTIYFRSHDGPVQLYSRFAMDTRDFNAFHFYTVSPLDFSRESTQAYWGQIRLEGKLTGNTSWTFNNVIKSHQDEFVFNPEFPKNDHTSRHFVSRLSAKHDISDQVSLSAGVSGWTRAIDSNNLGKHDDFTMGGYVHGRLQPAASLMLYGGFRVDHDRAFGTEFTPQLSANYLLGRVAIRANTGRAVRAPNYVEQYINFTRTPQRGRNYGNPDLRVEKAWSNEVGLDFYLNKGVSVSGTVFQRNTSNLIDFAQLDRDVQVQTLADSVLLAQNIAEINTRGIELEARLQRMLGRHQVELNTSFTYLDTDLEDVLESAVFKYASGHARNLIQSNVRWEMPGFNAGVQILWKEKLDNAKYGVVNLRGQAPIDLAGKQLSITAEIRNLFDETYTEVLDAPMPGRWVLFGVNLTL